MRWVCFRADMPPTIWVPGPHAGHSGWGQWVGGVPGGEVLGAHCGQRFQPAARALPWRVTGHKWRSAGLGRLPLPGCPTAASPVLMVWGGGGWHTWGGTGSLVLLGLSCRPLPLPPIEEVLESYENPPPIVLPSEGFQVDLEADCLDDSIYQHLLYIRHFLWSLRSKPSPSGGSSQLGGP